MPRRCAGVTFFVAAGILLGAPRLLACPVCFGASDSLMAAGVNAGIYVLLGVTSAVLTGVGLVAVRLARAEAAATSGGPEGPAIQRQSTLGGAGSSDAAQPGARPSC
jgi:hypothetical protein